MSWVRIEDKITFHAKVLPLAEFPPEKRAEIEAAVARGRPPARRVIFYNENGTPMFDMPSRAFYEWHWSRGVDPDKAREKIAPAMRDAVVAFHGMRCALCDGDIASALDLHIDHIRPVSRGGKNNFENLQPAHAGCNIRKSNKWSE